MVMAARLGDMHMCPMVTPGLPPIPHVGGPISGPCVPTILTCSAPQSHVGDMCVCVGPPDSIIMGCPTVMAGGAPAVRMGDNCAHGGAITLGAPTVLIGSGGGGGGGGGSSGVGGRPGGIGQIVTNAALAGGAMAPAAQAKALQTAASSGAPLCEQCNKP